MTNVDVTSPNSTVCFQKSQQTLDKASAMQFVLTLGQLRGPGCKKRSWLEKNIYKLSSEN